MLLVEDLEVQSRILMRCVVIMPRGQSESPPNEAPKLFPVLSPLSFLFSVISQDGGRQETNKGGRNFVAEL